MLCLEAFFTSKIHIISVGFLSSTAIMVWFYSQCMMRIFVSFCSIFLGLGGHDCRSPRKPLDEAQMQQRSNSLIFVFVPAGLFSYGICTLSQHAR